MKENLYKILPNFVQNLFVTGYNIQQNTKRYGGKYKEFRQHFKRNRTLSLDELLEIQNKRFLEMYDYVIEKSPFYQEFYKGIDKPKSVYEIDRLPIISKEILRKNIERVHTINSAEGIHSKTGGTTGKSLEVLFTPDNMQERFAMLDDFRGRFGYELGKKTAWFSGKNLLTERDLKKNRFWKTDFFYHVRYYSTFHIKEDYLRYYVENLIRFQPEYLSGFPSSIYEVAKYGIKNGYDFPNNTLKAIFTTAETLTIEMREITEEFFKAKIFNQYASSEGAPFIFECEKGNLHLELQSGVFEVLDENSKTCQSGRLVFTSFTTYGTPLIRYDIGDNISLDEKNNTCTCGNKNPIIKELTGRLDDYVYSPKNGKINIVNIANAIKDVNGIIKYQILQNDLNSLIFKIIIDKKKYGKKEEELFIKNWRDRIGDKMELVINYVDEIETEKSGKFRIVKNNIKHLLQ